MDDDHPEGLIAEVGDEIEYLAGRSTLEQRCSSVEAPDAERLEVLKEAYLAVPEHQRRFLPSQQAPLRSDWNVVLLSVMTRLVRAKFQQHPGLAEKLIATSDGRLINC